MLIQLEHTDMIESLSIHNKFLITFLTLFSRNGAFVGRHQRGEL